MFTKQQQKQQPIALRKSLCDNHLFASASHNAAAAIAASSRTNDEARAHGWLRDGARRTRIGAIKKWCTARRVLDTFFLLWWFYNPPWSTAVAEAHEMGFRSTAAAAAAAESNLFFRLVHWTLRFRIGFKLYTHAHAHTHIHGSTDDWFTQGVELMLLHQWGEGGRTWHNFKQKCIH